MASKNQRQEKQDANPLFCKNWVADDKKPSATVHSDKSHEWDESDPYQPPLPGEDGISRIINDKTHSFCRHCGWRSKEDGDQHTTKEHRAMTKAQPGKFKSKHDIFHTNTDQPPSKPKAATTGKPVSTAKPCKSNESKCELSGAVT